jgi:phage/plasmid-associated DNA primase
MAKQPSALTTGTNDALARALRKAARSVPCPRLRRWLERLASADAEIANEQWAADQAEAENQADENSRRTLTTRAC